MTTTTKPRTKALVLDIHQLGTPAVWNPTTQRSSSASLIRPAASRTSCARDEQRDELQLVAGVVKGVSCGRSCPARQSRSTENASDLAFLSPDTWEGRR